MNAQRKAVKAEGKANDRQRVKAAERGVLAWPPDPSGAGLATWRGCHFAVPHLSIAVENTCHRQTGGAAETAVPLAAALCRPRPAGPGAAAGGRPSLRHH